MKIEKIRIYWPYLIFGLFVVVIIVNIIYIFLARDSWRGLFTLNSYKKGVEYNKILKNIEEQYKVGIKINNTISKISSKKISISTYATDKTGATLNNISIIYIFKYLPDAKYDITKFIEQNTSFGHLDITLPIAGKWNLETIVKYNDKIVQDLAELEIKDDKNFEKVSNQ